jgi:hypothetical protein
MRRAEAGSMIHPYEQFYQIISLHAGPIIHPDRRSSKENPFHQSDAVIFRTAFRHAGQGF